MSALFERHIQLVEQAIEASHTRQFWAAWPEMPSPKVYGENAETEGLTAFQNSLNKPFSGLLQVGTQAVAGEVSPYTQEPLGISYPMNDADTLVKNANKAMTAWAKASVHTRLGILVESLERVKSRFFEIAYATMHTTGQAYMMSFQASGPHAADRALEAIAMGYEELTRFPSSVIWDKPMGKVNVVLEKSWTPRPKGIGLVIGCSTFPTWNTVPGMYADLITGNVVIVKPHPGAILPIAIFIAELQKVLKEEGFAPEICQLGADLPESPITRELASNESIRLIDYTGGNAFGSWLEGLKGKNLFTEKTGVNCVILDSCDDLNAVVQNLAFSICLYSGQMCTAPQNFLVPSAGIKTSEGMVSPSEFASKLSEAITGLIDNPKAGPHILGAIQNPATLRRVKDALSLGAEVVLEPNEFENSAFPKARTIRPALLKTNSDMKDLFSQELFGPIAMVIETKDTQESISLAAELAATHGAISCGAYTTSEAIMETIEEAMGTVYAPVSFNLTGGIYLNQHAAFSDFHVTGGNPAGNASFTNPEFITRRFIWTGSRKPAQITAS